MKHIATINDDGTVTITYEDGEFELPNENILADWLPDKDITIIRNGEVETKEQFLAKYYLRRHPQN